MKQSNIAMISQPMRGLTAKQIEKNRTAAVEYLESQRYEIVNTIYGLDDDYLEYCLGVKKVPLFYLARSIASLSICDAIFFCRGWDKSRGCRIEYECAKMYGVKMIFESEV